MPTNQEMAAQERVLPFLDCEIRGFVVGDRTLNNFPPQGTPPYTCQCT